MLPEIIGTQQSTNFGNFFGRIWVVTLILYKKIIYCNTFVLRKCWYLSGIYPTTNQIISKITSVIEMFVWRGHGLRVAFPQLTLPTQQGGLKLFSLGLKSKSLFLANFLKDSSNNSFITQFLNINNPPHIHSMPKIPYIKSALGEKHVKKPKIGKNDTHSVRMA
jgi:hypothetical protein